jgi:CheY-like chemotaxis protein
MSVGVQAPETLVLVVEDEHTIRRLLALLLKREGFSVAMAENGSEALQMLQMGERPDLMLVDLTMPVMGGHEFLARAKALGHRPPTIILSAAVEAPDVTEALGCEAFSPKPYHFPELLGLVRTVLKAA